MVYGVDIGGTKIDMAVFTDHFQLLERWRVATPTDDYPLFLATISQLIAQADQYLGQRAPLGIALPGVVTPQGMLISSNVNCLNQRSVAAELTTILQRPVALGNDCRLFVLSEATLGAGRGYHRVFGVVLGTGAGGGLCINGEIYQGKQQLAGEFGHQSIAGRVLLQHQLPLYPCGCGLFGCAETYISGTGLARLYRHFSQQERTTYDWLDAFRRGEQAAKQTFDCYMDALGACLASQILAYDPDVIVLGGGLSEIEEILLQLPTAIARHLFAGAKVPPLHQAEFGVASGPRGAAILGLRAAHSFDQGVVVSQLK